MSDAELRAELDFWRALAEERGRVIGALHEFNYWHESTVARGEVVAGLEQSVAMWRERCLAAEARFDPHAAAPPGGAGPVARAKRLLRRVAKGR